MSEQSMRNTVKRHLQALPQLHWQRIEDSLSSGIPDINFCYMGVDYWVEAKQMDEHKLPKRETTPVRIGLRPEQALWLRARKNARGNALVLCKIGGTWLLFNDHFEELRDGAVYLRLMIIACSVWRGSFDVEKFLHWRFA